jgi:hypothetical protein
MRGKDEAMSDKKHDTQRAPAGIGRRAFIRKTGMGAGALGVASLVGAKAAEAAAGSATGAGYRETEHVKTYYKLAKF